MLNEFVGFIGTILGGVGVYLTIKSLRKDKRLKTIDWNDINSAVRFFWKKLHKEDFIPDFIISPGQKGGIIAQMLAEMYKENIPVLTGFLEHANSPEIDTDDYLILKTSKWNVYLPGILKKYSNKQSCRVLIIDDFTMSGDFLQTIKRTLNDFGYRSTDVRSCTVAVTKVALDAKKAPDYYWKVVEDRDFYFPWGKAE